MSYKARPTYTAEFKAQAIELLALGKPVNQVAEELCVSSNLLYSWRRSSPPQGTQGGSAGGRAVGEDSGADALGDPGKDLPPGPAARKRPAAGGE
jgi:transposase